jgi:hypothetical protein
MSDITPADAAKVVRLRYVDDAKPGITRKATKEGWDFFAPNGARITDEGEIARIRKLAIPPAHKDVWICPQANGHIQAVGRDTRGRKQYRYHAILRDEAKYAYMLGVTTRSVAATEARALVASSFGAVFVSGAAPFARAASGCREFHQGRISSPFLKKRTKKLFSVNATA